jgi:putative FmdB family regulatory protein
MPIYEYRCQECGKTSELLQRMSDPPMAACPLCGGPVKKLISSPAVQFKGSGWYVTDYGSKKNDAGASGGSKSHGGQASEGGSSSEGGSGKDGGKSDGGGESKAAEKSSSSSSSESSSSSSESKAANASKAAKSSD